MKKNSFFLLFALLAAAAAMLAFSAEVRSGAYNGLVLAQNTVVPSLLPLLIIFLLIMKTPARDALAHIGGFISVRIFNLPKITFPAIFFGLIGGYPTGALMTRELFESGDIDSRQAHAMLRFNFCGGCGFIITAVGSAVLSSAEAGLILYGANVVSSVIIGFALSFTRPRTESEFFSSSEARGFADALTEAVESAVKSVLAITAFVMLFSAADSVLNPPDFLLPLAEITNGVCGGGTFTLPQTAAYLAFGGICIHMQLLPVIAKCGMKWGDFLLSRAAGALLSYAAAKIILLIFPVDTAVFSNLSGSAPQMSGLDAALSVLLVLGCAVLVLDLGSRKRRI